MRLQRCRLGVMPDPALYSTIDDLPEVPADRQAILPMEPHHFVESEFPAGKGHCDLCGGGPLAAIHTHVDPLERIADSLQEIAGALHRQEDRLEEAIERIADVAEWHARRLGKPE